MDPRAKKVSIHKVVVVVLFHFFSAISTTLASKASLNRVHSPIGLLAFQTLFQAVFLGGFGAISGHVDVLKSFNSWKEILPLTLARSVGILAKTYCLAAVDASFYQIARGLLLPFTVLLSLICLRPRPRISSELAGSIAIVIAGFAIGFATDFSANLSSARGLALGIGSSFTTSVECVTVKYFLLNEKENIFQLAYMSSASQSLLFAALFTLSGEGQSVYSSLTYLKSLLFGSFVMGVTNTFLIAATFAQISVTSPITHAIAAAARGVVHSLLARIIFHEVLSVGRAASISILTVGTILYCFIKNAEESRLSSKHINGQATADEGALLLEDNTEDEMEHLKPSEKVDLM